jgi:hypothetical protein
VGGVAFVSGEAPAAPKPGCLMCGKAQRHLTVNTQAMTLQQLLDKVGLRFWLWCGLTWGWPGGCG